jgi:hypothetical protein
MFSSTKNSAPFWHPPKPNVGDIALYPFGSYPKQQISDLVVLAVPFSIRDILSSVSKGDGKYQYSFNGIEKDNELKGEGNSLDFGARIYDSRLGRWQSVVPLARKQQGWSTYKFGEILCKQGDVTYLPESGSFLIHSHQDGIRKNQKDEAEYSKANEPSDKDKKACLNFDTNIIVGENGRIHYTKDEFGDKIIDKCKRYPAINIFNRNAKFLSEVGREEVENMLSNYRGKLGGKFERKLKQNEK